MGDEMDGEMGRQMRGDVAQKRAPIIFQARQLFFNPRQLFSSLPIIFQPYDGHFLVV